MAYSIVVLVKQVPDLNAVRVDKASGKPLLGDQLVLGAADAIAVEAALQLKEAHGGEVTVVSAGPPSVKDALQRALAMGADRALLAPIDQANALDTLALSRVLAGVLSGLTFDILITGQNSDDYESGQVPAQVAELLGLPQVSWVTKLVAVDGGLAIERDTEDGKQQVIAATPVVIMAADGLNEPRYPSLKGIMAAKKKPLETVEVAAVSATTDITWSDPAAPQKPPAGIIVQDKPAAEAVAELVAWLRTKNLA
ncbi:MAG: electron transfer flavoprotein subunit beta/FixA family protein [Thermomicrobiales bacterium]|nr:electron transfer flavoprotein subunit beta/FixA family protein [Thermomicrobiales bacterium]